MNILAIIFVSYFSVILQHWTPDGVNDDNVVSTNFKNVQECGLYLSKLNLSETRADSEHVAWTAEMQLMQWDIDKNGKIKSPKIFNYTDSLSAFMDNRDLYKPWKDAKSTAQSLKKTN